ncbi:MAG: bifunctional phosphopantothenoylcysteine decarboxylase/phosphopantothenate--cysteine ligase CoaBC [Bdellovibrionales bacterium]|nr:bifunctional phosphopantothenoylcysteine decarboxylase/phosphopantothenate--cysteine ligase CoaBC [Bdellovibrionales bacterium]
MSKSKILFMMSGSIAAFKACQAISRLVQEGHEVQPVLTASALHFIGPATLEGLTGRAPLTNLWEQGRAMEHIHLTRWADMAVLCPASANTLAKIAHGMAEDLVGALTLAWPMNKPFHIFPAMNTVMLNATATQDNLRTLKARGFRVATTTPGALACGETGEGRLLEPEDILKTLFESNVARETRREATGSRAGRVLITAGATREAIDGIRFISNVSTGQTGAALADQLSARGWQVTYLHGQGAMRPTQTAHTVSFTDYTDLDRKLKTELDQRDYDGVIHAAAVSDYSIEHPNNEIKLSSEGDLTLRLKPNAKLLPKLKRYSRRPGLQVIGFKLTLNATEAETERRAESLINENVDAVVANDWAQVSKDRRRHPGRLVTRQGVWPFQNLEELAEALHMRLSAAKERAHDLMS